MQDDWAYNEWCRTPLWDQRCRTTLVLSCQQLAQQAQVSFSRALGSQRKAVSRILHHKETTPDTLLSGHVRATALRCQAEELVLIASDTTSYDFSTHKAVDGLGTISDKEYQRGFLVHSALALTTQGVPLGLLHQQSWVRDPGTFGSAQKRRERAFEDKESSKWLVALRAVEAALPATQKALLLQDREADVFAFFAAPRREGLHLLIRATQPRRLEMEDVAEGGSQVRTVLEAVAQAPVVGSKTVAVRARPDREAREALLQVRLTQVTICAPRSQTGSKAQPKTASVPVWMIRACEETPSEGTHDPIEWLLLTTLPDVDAALALRLVDYYALRWRIERFHYILKSGCGYEKLQLDRVDTLQKALSLYSVVAWRLLLLTSIAQATADAPANEVLSAVEREVLERSRGKPIHTAREALVAVAQLAGFVSVPSAPLPGVKSLWLGFRTLQDIVTGYLLARNSLSPPI